MRFGSASSPWEIYRFREVSSTNDMLREHLDSLGDRSVVLAEFQYAGRGRLGRAWASPPGNLYASILWKPAPAMDACARVSLLVADLICDILGSSGIRGEVKWPNDVVIGGRKIAGILPESGTHPLPWLIMGIGMNISVTPRLSDLRGLEPVSWADAGRPGEPFDILLDLLERLDRAWPGKSHDPIEGRRDSISARLWCRGQLVRITRGSETTAGTLTGIDSEGRLVLATSSGAASFESGELRPI